MRHLIRIGFDTLDGYLDGGMEAWGRARLPMDDLPTMTSGDLYAQIEGGAAPLPLDVRFGYEWRLGHVPGALHIELGQLPSGTASLARDRSYATLCAGGIRACTAASIMEREGFGEVALVEGGTNAWQKAGYPLDVPED